MHAVDTGLVHFRAIARIVNTQSNDAGSKGAYAHAQKRKGVINKKYLQQQRRKSDEFDNANDNRAQILYLERLKNSKDKTQGQSYGVGKYRHLHGKQRHPG